MTEVTAARRWPPRSRPKGCSEAAVGRAAGPSVSEPRFLRPGSRPPEPSYLKYYMKMKRKGVNAGKLRLSPNEEAFILKEDYERRRKLRLLQVREQERDIALQIREDIKQRRNQQFTRLAEELRTEWEESQTQKIKNLEKLYLASLRNMGEGHQQAKENEPDLNALAHRAAERKKKAEMRHKEALKVQKNQKEMLMKQKTWHIKARKEALLVEKERSAKIASLPPPPPALFENVEVKKTNVKTNSSTYHHLCTFVSREVDTKQPDPHLAAEEEAKRLEELQKQAAQEKKEQSEKAHARGFQAMKKIHLAQNQEKLMKELQQLQQEDLARRRLMVARMPPQLLELPYKRSEMKEDWQRELEFAFEDMYNADRKVKGNLILHLEPEPLPAVIDQIQDEELDLSMEHESLGETENIPMTEAETVHSSEADVPSAVKTHQIPSKILFKKLLNKIRSQKSLWTIKSMSEEESEMITTVSEAESKALTVESGATVSEDRTLSSGQEQVVESDMLTVDSGPLTSEDKPLSSEDKPLSFSTDSEKEQEMKTTQPIIAVAPSSVLLHPQEEAVRIRMAARQKQIMEIEEQKQKQLELLEQIEQQKLRLETDCFRAQLEEEKRKKTQQTGVSTAPASYTICSDEDRHRQMIRIYQQQLLQQNRFHKQSVETARKRLLEYQTMLRGKYPSLSATPMIPAFVTSVPPPTSERPTAPSEQEDQGQRPKLSPNKQPVPPVQVSRLEQDYQVSRQNRFPQRQVETTEALVTSDVLAKQALESQEHRKQLSQTEVQQRDYKLVAEDSQTLARTLSHDKPLTVQDARERVETSGATAFQSLDSQQVFSENNKSVSSKLIEPSSFLPLVAKHSFISLPTKVESGEIQQPFSTASKGVVSVAGQMQDKSLPFSENIIAQQSNLKALQEQLDLQKEVLRTRQEAQEQLLLCKQKELEGQTGLSIFLPLVPLNSFASLPSAQAESRRIQESSPTKKETGVSSGHPGVPQLQDRLNLKFFQEQLKMQMDSLQARREAQEVLCVHKQNELDGRVRAEQTGSSSLPPQVAQHTFTSLPSAQSGKIQDQYSSKTEKECLSIQTEMPTSQDGSLGFPQQFQPLHDCLKLLQEKLITQRDALQARHEAQAELLSRKQRNLEDAKSVQMSSSFLPVVTQHSLASQVSAKTEPRRIQNFYFSERDSVIPSSNLVMPAFQDASLSFPQYSLPQQENLMALHDQSHLQRVILGDKQETQEFVHKQSELEKIFPSEQTGTSLSLSQGAESERCQEYMSFRSDSTVPLSHWKIPRSQERLLGFSRHAQSLQGNLEGQQERLDREEEALQFSQRSQGNVSSEQTCPSFTPQLGQLSLTPLPSAESREPLSAESESRTPSSRFQIPALQDRLRKLSQLIQPQQDNLKSLQEQLATQREAIIQSRQGAQREFLLHKQGEWKGRVSPEQVGPSSFLPQVAQLPFASLSPSDAGGIQEPCSTKSDNIVSSGHSEIPRLPDRLLGLPQPVLPQQDYPVTFQQEHLYAQTNPLPRSEKIQKELVLPRQYTLEGKSPEHFLQPHHDDLLKACQQQLDIQREVQEEFLLQTLSKLDKGVSAEQTSASSSLSHIALPVADSEGMPKSFPARSDLAVSSSHPEILRSQERPLHLSQAILPQQDHVSTQLGLQGEVLRFSEKAEEERLGGNQTKLIEGDASGQPAPSLFLPKEREHSFIPLPFAEVKSQNICELYSAKIECAVPSSASVSPRLQDRILSFSQPIFAQQDNWGLQKQLELQKEVLHFSQKAQEVLLVQRQTALQQQTQKHQETLKDFFKDSQESKPTVENDFETQTLREWLPHLHDQENIGPADRSNCDDHQLLSEGSSAKRSGVRQDKELGRKSSKPPVAKVRGGLDLNQHELSAIQEVESPTSGRTSLLGKPDFYQDRDPLRVSISREQSFLGSPLDHDPFGHLHPVAQENICGDDSDKAVKAKEAVVENHAVLSYAVEREGHMYLNPNVKSDVKAETQEVYHEPLSSITVSTGSFLSYENIDLSLTEPESVPEHVDHREQEPPASKEEETNVLSSRVPSTQDIYQRQDSWDVHKPLLCAVETMTSGQTHIQQMRDKYITEANLMTEKTDFRVDFDFPELEHSFPNLHHQLFKPLEPHPDFDVFSSFSGISQDSKDFNQRSGSSCESLHATSSPKSVACFTALRRTSLHSSNTSLNQQPDPNMACDAAQSFAAEDIEGSEQSFRQLQPEYSSQEGSQHADLPSIFSIEARASSQGVENQNCSSEQNELLQNQQKSVHFQLSVGNLQSLVFSSSGEANVFHQLNLQHITPCGSTSSERSIKDQPEGRKERLGFEKLSERLDTVLQGQGFTDDKKETCDLNPHIEEIDSHLCVRTVEMGTSIQIPYSLTVQNEKCLQDSAVAGIPTIIGNPSQLAQSELFVNSGSFSLQRSIPVWETESGHGIMEEPELTLTSTSDISIAEMDFANLTLEEKRENEAKSCFQVSDPAMSEHPLEKPTVCAETFSRCTAAPENLQEAFIKRKKAFVERSSQRQKEIKDKVHASGNSQTKTITEKTTGSFVSHLKGMSKVKVSLPEDKKTAQPHTHQRALGLYLQLAEIKKQKEEKAKQDVHAQSRARTKEFHKKTLEKLRARNTC